MQHIQSFAPIERADARILILGSIPGEASLRAGQYYAHPRNLFWPIMCELFGIEPTASYAEKTQALKSAHIALWDVLRSCRRNGSMDSNIDDHSLVANNFKAFFDDHPDISRVFFNGAKADECYRRHVLSGIKGNALEYVRLPSTSPANASVSYERKLKVWHVITE